MTDPFNKPQKDSLNILPELRFINSKDPLDPKKLSTSSPTSGQQKEELVHKLIDRINTL
jgi:hypothetical protein